MANISLFADFQSALIDYFEKIGDSKPNPAEMSRILVALAAKKDAKPKQCLLLGAGKDLYFFPACEREIALDLYRGITGQDNVPVRELSYLQWLRLPEIYYSDIESFFQYNPVK